MNGVGPEIGCNSLWPSFGCMNLHYSGLGLQLSDFVLSNTILMMASHSKGQALMFGDAVSSLDLEANTPLSA